MKKNNFMNLINKQVESLKQSSDTKGENDKLLDLIKIALARLKHNRYNSDILKEYEQLEIRRMFVVLCAVAQEAYDFMSDVSNSQKSGFNPIASTKEMGKKLATIIANVNQIKSDIEVIERDNAEILKQEAVLRECISKRQALSKKADELKEIYTNGYRDIDNYEKRCAELISSLNEIEAKRNYYALHLESNSEIAMQLHEHGFSTTQGFIDEIREFENVVKAELARYDNRIRSVIEQREQLKKKIEDMQSRL